MPTCRDPRPSRCRRVVAALRRWCHIVLNGYS
jgi:hypothetical protein